MIGSITSKATKWWILRYCRRTATNCSADVTIEALAGTEYAGLFTGELNYGQYITSCRASGKITGSATNIGGFIGNLGSANKTKEIKNSYCYAYINMTSATNVGGFSGKDNFTSEDHTSKYTNCYCNTIIEGAGTNKKGFLGTKVDGCTSEANGCV